MTDDSYHLDDAEDRSNENDHQHAVEASQHALDALANGDLSHAHRYSMKRVRLSSVPSTTTESKPTAKSPTIATTDPPRASEPTISLTDNPSIMAIESLTHPSAEDTLDLLTTGFARGGMLTLVGECEVDYDGRASSHLSPGERLVILKPDGTLLVHRDSQRKPVNWQPPGSTHSARLDGDHLIVESVRTSPHEEIEIIFETLVQASLLELDDAPELALEGSEEDLRQRILANPDVLEAGFKAMATERETAAGPIDIYGKDADGTSTAVELKRRRVGPDAVGQLNRYVDALRDALPVRTTVRGILVAPSITQRAEDLLASNDLEFVSLTPTSEESPDSTQLTGFENTE